MMIIMLKIWFVVFCLMNSTLLIVALQARTGYGWEWLSPDGFVLNSKWNEAEKYICNPLSGEVPIECLSSKTLRRRSLSTSTSKITISAPLVYGSRPRLSRSKSTITQDHHEIDYHSTIQGFHLQHNYTLFYFCSYCRRKLDLYLNLIES